MKRWLHLILTTVVTFICCLIVGMSKSSVIPVFSPEYEADRGAQSGDLTFSIAMTNGANSYAADLSDIGENKWVKELEALTNTNLQITLIPLKDFDKRMPILLAGDSYPDVVQMVGGASAAAMSGSVQAGLFMPLDDLIQIHAPNLWEMVPEDAWKETSYEGHVYGIPAWLGNSSRRATYIRSDLLEATGLPIPKTVDEFLNMLREFKKLGVENPYQMREDFKYADVIFGAYDVLGYQYEVRNEEVVPKFFNEERMMKALNIYKTMLNEGLIPDNFAVIRSTEYTHSINEGEAGSWTANAAGLLDFRTKVKTSVPGARVDIIASPQGPDKKKGYGLYSSVINSFYINKNVSREKAIGILKFFDWMVSNEAQRFHTFGISGDTYTTHDDVIQYKFPETQKEQDEQNFRELLWLSHDLTINRARTKLLPGGGDMLKALDVTLSREGLGSIIFVPELESFSLYPDLASQRPDQPPKLIIDHMVKMIYGIEPISDWPKVIQEYKDRGGDAIIQEATSRYRTNKGVIIQESR
ncbi:putative aldouronate transport system substrate-binding protein [Paenibacillus sp. DS2015]|uniref:extracellular solute-binding protein n=1 Tax=Paenibacillus sp. DS2015 TaxID=3373917 RepID=UPI003D214D03